MKSYTPENLVAISRYDFDSVRHPTDAGNGWERTKSIREKEKKEIWD